MNNHNNNNNKKLLPEQSEVLLKVLESRFKKNMNRHKDIDWNKVQTRLESDAYIKKLWSLNEMEKTGGEPDIVGYDAILGEYIFYDCAPESPIGRRNICYDRQALDERKEHKPANNATDMATNMGIELLTEDQYRQLQEFGNFDTKTSSWIKTPAEIRERGGALFGDCRYGRVFIYHNSAPSYYGVRGFRGTLRV